MGPGGLATPNRAGVCGRPPTNRPLLAVREDGGVYSPSLRSRAVRLPPTPCRVCFRPCVFNKFSHFWQKNFLFAAYFELRNCRTARSDRTPGCLWRRGQPEAKWAQEWPRGTRDNRHTPPGRARAAGHVYADDHQSAAVPQFIRVLGRILPGQASRSPSPRGAPSPPLVLRPGSPRHSHSLSAARDSPAPTKPSPSCALRPLQEGLEDLEAHLAPQPHVPAPPPRAS